MGDFLQVKRSNFLFCIILYKYIYIFKRSCGFFRVSAFLFCSQ
nr:MAG TPA: hypothetical protein [Caudoviricetes sp.]